MVLNLGKLTVTLSCIFLFNRQTSLPRGILWCLRLHYIIVTLAIRYTTNLSAIWALRSTILISEIPIWCPVLIFSVILSYRISSSILWKFTITINLAVTNGTIRLMLVICHLLIIFFDSFTDWCARLRLTIVYFLSFTAYPTYFLLPWQSP